MSQLTIRDLDPRVEALIRRVAGEEGRSLSEVASRLLTKGAGLADNQAKKRNLRTLPGRWSREEAAAFEKSQAPFGHIDEEVWQ